MGLLPLDNVGPLGAVIACGVCVGFLPFNFHPAKIFMGDAGAPVARPVDVGPRPCDRWPHPPTSGSTYFFFAPVFIPFFILGVPLIDMAFAFIRRTARGTGFHTPDKTHPPPPPAPRHGHRRSVLILWRGRRSCRVRASSPCSSRR